MRGDACGEKTPPHPTLSPNDFARGYPEFVLFFTKSLREREQKWAKLQLQLRLVLQQASAT